MTPDISAHFRALAIRQLDQFAATQGLRRLMLYLTMGVGDTTPSLSCVAAWPSGAMVLPPAPEDADVQLPEQGRRWLPLRHGGLLLGALLVETEQLPWSAELAARLQAAAECLAQARALDLQILHLQRELEGMERQRQRQQEQLAVLAHQMRNPVAALRTFGQLLLRRMDGDDARRGLVEGLLEEGEQLNRYVDALDTLPAATQLLEQLGEGQALLLPPLPARAEEQPLAERLLPLIQRAAANCEAQGRPWHGPGDLADLPPWCGDVDAVCEVLANLLENAFRYSPPGSAVGLVCQATDDVLQLAVWDGGKPIATAEQERIFARGMRGSSSSGREGSGLGLALGRDLARQLGGDLRWCSLPELAELNPSDDLPDQGNAFLLQLPLVGCKLPGTGQAAQARPPDS